MKLPPEVLQKMYFFVHYVVAAHHHHIALIHLTSSLLS